MRTEFFPLFRVSPRYDEVGGKPRQASISPRRTEWRAFLFLGEKWLGRPCYRLLCFLLGPQPRFELGEFWFLGQSFESPFSENEFVLPKCGWLDREHHRKV